MNHVYAAFFATDSRMGKLIRVFTRNRYNHAALSLSRDLSYMYSFARYQKAAPLAGGFVIERPGRFTGGETPVPLKIAKISLDERQYLRLRAIVGDCETRNQDWIYNSFDAFLSLFGVSLRIRDSHTCVSFVCHALGYSGIKNIRALEKRLADGVIYEGDCKEYLPNVTADDPDYYRRLTFPAATLKTFRHFARLFRRLL